MFLLSVFIRDSHEQIIVEFADFARTLMPAGANMSETELRDHADDILTAVVQDMETAQTGAEQSQKSQGHGSAHVMQESGNLHADDRIQHGFSFGSVLAEFRALRATVLRLYAATGGSDLHGVRRFNEAVDEALTESMERFAVQTDLFRHQFIGVLSHDLRSPLSAITTGAALLALAGDDPQSRRRTVARITNSAQRMERMIADLLDLTRVRLGGSMPLRRQSTDLGQVCDEVMLEIGAGFPGSVVRLTTTGDLRGNWDADRLAQVLSNLIGNAIQHGDGTPIILTALDQGDEAIVAVRNGGRPIPADVLPLVFEPLARGNDDEGGVHSIGLGLFIARAITAGHGGSIDVSSSIEHGTTFTVRLPKQGPTASGRPVHSADRTYV